MSGKKSSQSGRFGRTKTVFQIEASECGAASLSMILKFYGCHVPMEELRIACGVSRNGTNAATLVIAGDKYGLSGKGYKMNTEELRNAPVPCILHWGGNHFVVLEGFAGKKACINDPASGRKKLNMQELERDFSGVVLCFSPNENFRKRGEDYSSLRLFLGRFKSEIQGFVFLLVTALVLTVPGLILAAFTQMFMDNMFAKGDAGWLTMIIVGMALVSIGQIFLTFIQSNVLSRMNRKLSLETGKNLFERMIRLPLAFYEQRYAGDLSQREDNNSNINNFLSGAFTASVLGMIHVLFYLLLMIRYSPKLTVIGLAGVALNVFLMEVLMRPLADYSVKRQQDKNRNMGYLCAGLSVYGSIKAGGTENDYVSELVNQYANVTKSEQKADTAQQILNTIPGNIARIFNILVMLLGSAMVIRGNMSGGKLFAFCQLLSSFMIPINTFLSLQKKYQSTKADLVCVEDIECAEADRWYTNENTTTEGEPVLTGWLEARHLTFGYDPNLEPVLSDFNLRLAPGKSVGIVGDSGCGKSTAAKLLASLIKPWSGSVVYNGKPAEELSKDTLVSAISMVNQHESFFTGTIYENVSLWDTQKDRSKVLKALEDSGAMEFINRLPGGVDYRLTEGGCNLSGGQRQQLAIARALVDNPKILFLDEATSAMDPIIEEKAMKCIAKRGCTLVTVAHRLSTVKGCDLIIVMQKGRIKEAGTHAKLMETKGLYYAMQQ